MGCRMQPVEHEGKEILEVKRIIALEEVSKAFESSNEALSLTLNVFRGFGSVFMG